MKNTDDVFIADTHEALQTAMAEASKTEGINVRGGKEYLEVKKRVAIFRKHFGTCLGIETDILVANDKIVRVKAIVRDKAAMIVGSGIAEELRGDGTVNKTSAVENAETSAIGRALASIGLHGSEYASANEMDAVVRKEAVIDQTPPAPTPAPAATPDPAPTASPDEPMTEEDALHLVSMEQKSIEAMTKLSELESYRTDNAFKLKRLRDAHPTIADELAAFYTQHYKEIENG